MEEMPQMHVLWAMKKVNVNNKPKKKKVFEFILE